MSTKYKSGECCYYTNILIMLTILHVFQVSTYGAQSDQLQYFTILYKHTTDICTPYSTGYNIARPSV
jgi:hypothetical protein